MQCAITSFLGMRVTQDLDKGTIKLDQEAMIIAVLDRFGMGDCKPARLPMLDGSDCMEGQLLGQND
eukprot:295382-Chlamydomonas_euryale.AAC.1